MAKKKPKKIKKPPRGDLSNQPKRPRGRPKTGDSPIGPEELQYISEQLAEGWPLMVIAKELGVSKQAVFYHINGTVRPALREPWRRAPEMTLNELEHIIRVCWQQFRSEAPAETVEDIKQALEGSGDHKRRMKIVEKSLKKSFRPGQSAWLRLALDAIMQKASLLGYMAPNVTVMQAATSDDEYRVAGASRAQVDREMIQYVAALMEDRRREERARRGQLEDNTIDAEP